MLRKVLTLGMVFILALSLLAVSMITCFSYDAEAHDGPIHYNCWADAARNHFVGVFHTDQADLHCQTQ